MMDKYVYKCDLEVLCTINAKQKQLGYKKVRSQSEAVLQIGRCATKKLAVSGYKSHEILIIYLLNYMQ